jgi:hypothetical protein
MIPGVSAGAVRRGKLNADRPHQAGYREGGDRAQHQAHQPDGDYEAVAWRAAAAAGGGTGLPAPKSVSLEVMRLPRSSGIGI